MSMSLVVVNDPRPNGLGRKKRSASIGYIVHTLLGIAAHKPDRPLAQFRLKWDPVASSPTAHAL